MRTLQLGLVVMAGLLVSLTSSCSAMPPTPHPPITTNPCQSAKGTDFLCYLSDGSQQDSHSIDQAHQLGLTQINNPRQAFKKSGATGLAPLGTSCLVILGHEDGVSVTTISVLITGRYSGTDSLTLIYEGRHLRLSDAKMAIQGEEGTCETSNPVPAPTVQPA